MMRNKTESYHLWNVLSSGEDGLETNNYLNNYMITSVMSATKG